MPSPVSVREEDGKQCGNESERKPNLWRDPGSVATEIDRHFRRAGNSANRPAHATPAEIPYAHRALEGRPSGRMDVRTHGRTGGNIPPLN